MNSLRIVAYEKQLFEANSPSGNNSLSVVKANHYGNEKD
jgi:hypothetical protein